MKTGKHLSLRMDGALHDRFRYAAGCEGRSRSRQMLDRIASAVRAFEREYGTLPATELCDGEA